MHRELNPDFPAVTSKIPDDLIAHWTSQWQTRDGVAVCIRPLRFDDREREIAFMASLSERTRYLRLLTPLKYLPPHLLDQLMDVDYDRRMAFVATVIKDGIEIFAGVARYGESLDTTTAELGVTVADEWQKRGVASRLIRQVLLFAKWRGFRRIEGLVLRENDRMLALARSAGFTMHFNANDHLMHIAYELAALTSDVST